MREYMLKTFICHFLPKDFFLVSRFECSYKNNVTLIQTWAKFEEKIIKAKNANICE